MMSQMFRIAPVIALKITLKITLSITLGIALLACWPVARAAGDEAWLAGLDALTPEARFRQLSLMLLVSDGSDAKLVGTLESRLDGRESTPGEPPDFDFDDYTTPLIRIVDQETMLAGATRLFRFTREHAAQIATHLERLREAFPAAARTIPASAITEDAIIIRNAIADSMDYAEYSGGDPDGVPEEPLSRNYRERTIYLRNNLEYTLFSAELDRITREAVASVGGQTDAYERMFDDEVDAAGLDKKIKAAEYVYGWDRKFDERAARMAEEILNNIWDRETAIDPP